MANLMTNTYRNVEVQSENGAWSTGATLFMDQHGFAIELTTGDFVGVEEVDGKWVIQKNQPSEVFVQRNVKPTKQSKYHINILKPKKAKVTK